MVNVQEIWQILFHTDWNLNTKLASQLSNIPVYSNWTLAVDHSDVQICKSQNTPNYSTLFEFPKAKFHLIKSYNFWDIMLCSKFNQHYGGTYLLHFETGILSHGTSQNEAGSKQSKNRITSTRREFAIQLVIFYWLSPTHQEDRR